MKKKKIYDFAVIGGGIAGLANACFLKKFSRNKKLILFEKNRILGGLSASQKLGEYGIDSVYMFPDISNYLNLLDIKFPLYKYKKAFYEIRLIDGRKTRVIDLPPDNKKFRDELMKKFPEEKDSLEAFLGYCAKIEKQFLNLKSRLGFSDIIKMLINSRELIFSGFLTVSGLIKKFKFKDKNLIRVFESFAGLAQLPPEKLNALIPVIAMINLVKGTYRQPGQFSSLINRLYNRLKGLGAEINLRSEVTGINKNGKNLFEIRLKNNSVYYSRKIISCIDTKKIFLNVLSENLVPQNFRRKIQRLEMTLSCFVMRIIIKSNTPYETDTGQVLFYGGDNTFSYLYNKAVKNECILNRRVFHFAATVKKINAAKNIYFLEMISVPVPYGYWKKIFDENADRYMKEIEIWEEFFIGKLERHFDPDIRKKIIRKNSMTPVNFGKFFNLTDASLYDMSQVNNQAGMNRIGFRVPVKNFYHCKMVHGIFGSFFQALITSDYILDGKINNHSYRLD